MRFLLPLLLLACASCSDKYILRELDVPVLEGDVEVLLRESNQRIPVAVYARPDCDREDEFVNCACALLELGPKWTVVSRPSPQGSPMNDAVGLAKARQAGARYVLFFDATRTEGEEQNQATLTIHLVTAAGEQVATIESSGSYSLDAGLPNPTPLTTRALSMLGPDPVTEPYRHEMTVTAEDQILGALGLVVILAPAAAVYFL